MFVELQVPALVMLAYLRIRKVPSRGTMGCWDPHGRSTPGLANILLTKGCTACARPQPRRFSPAGASNKHRPGQQGGGGAARKVSIASHARPSGGLT